MERRHWLDILLSPLTLLERTRGWRRLVLLGFYGLILSVVVVLFGRESVLWQIPNSPEPFDLAKYGHVDLPDADNAMVLYKEAARLLVPDRQLFANTPRQVRDQWDWTLAPPKIQEWATRNQSVLAIWLQATERPDALLVQPEEYRSSTILDPFHDFRTLAYLGELEATRRQAAGDLAGAWIYHRAVLRSAVHAGHHGGLMPGLIAAALLRQANPRIRAWVDDPQQTSELLIRAVADLAACQKLRATTADVIRAEYFASRATLAEPTEWSKMGIEPENLDSWYQHFPGFLPAKHFLRNEPKRSLKLFRLITAGQLAQVDRPKLDRPQVVCPRYLLYAIDSTTPAPLARINPETLAAWADASGCHGLHGDFAFIVQGINATANLLDSLQLRLAERAFAVDHGGQPPQTAGELMGRYLDKLPEGFNESDLLNAP